MVVVQTLTSLALNPAAPVFYLNQTQQFTATGDDQFGVAMATQPTVTWKSTIGTISATGLFHSPDAHAVGTVTATSGSIKGVANVVVNHVPPQIATPPSANPSPVTAKTTVLSVLGWDDLGKAALVYTWTATTIPSGAAAPTFSANGTNASKTTTATFSHAGNYVFTVTLKDTGGLSFATTLAVTVQQTLTSIAVSPARIDLLDKGGNQQQFTATGYDQFGNALVNQPTFNWATTTGGQIDSTGLFTVPTTVAHGNVTASVGSGAGTITGTATLSIGPTLITSITVPPATAAGQTLSYSAAYLAIDSEVADRQVDLGRWVLDDGHADRSQRLRHLHRQPRL